MQSTTKQINFQKLAEKYGTPLYVYDAEKIKSQINLLKTNLGEVKIQYAIKALSNISILKWIKMCGAGVDAVSIQEVLIAMKAGYEAKEIMFTPNGVGFDEIVEAVSLGVSVNIDNLPILKKFGERYGSQYPCCLRITPHIMAGGNIKISTGHSFSKFGISIHRKDSIKKIVEDYKIDVQGFHIHTGSEITDMGVFVQVTEILFGLAKEFGTVKFIDCGGGFKVAYKQGDTVTDITELGKILTKGRQEFQNQTGRTLEVWIEPGKFLVAEAGSLLVKANVVKETPEVTFVAVNSGLNHLIRPMMYDAYHEIVNISNREGAEKKYHIVGNICETDTFGSNRMLNEVREGDLLIIKTAGAYGYSMASNYNSRFRPAEVLIVDNTAKLIRMRDTIEQLIDGQIVVF